MEQITRFRIPIITGVGALVLVIVVYMAWISPEGTKLASARAQQTQLESQQMHLQTELITLRGEKAHQVSNCQQLTNDLTQVPGTPAVDAFFQQVSQLAVNAGDPNTPSISVTNATGGAGGTKEVAVTLTLTGSYSQMTAFLSGLETFPRLFTVSAINVTGGPVATGGSAPSGGNYSLNLTGDIYYSAGQADVCASAAS